MVMKINLLFQSSQVLFAKNNKHFPFYWSFKILIKSSSNCTILLKKCKTIFVIFKFKTIWNTIKHDSTGFFFLATFSVSHKHLELWGEQLYQHHFFMTTVLCLTKRHSSIKTSTFLTHCSWVYFLCPMNF